MIVTVYYAFIKKGKSSVPELGPVQAISEAVDRSVEMGKPVHYAGGELSGVGGEYAAMTVAMLTGLRYVAGLCADKGARLIAHASKTAEIVPLMQQIVREQYALKGKADKFNIGDVRFYGELYAAGILEGFATDGVGCNITLGASAGDAVVVMDSARRHGAVNIGGTGRWGMQYAFATLCDYMLIGPEIYAAAAVMSNDERQLRTITSEDIIKTIVIALLISGFVLTLAGSTIIQTILSI